jgi:hypothetical protein
VNPAYGITTPLDVYYGIFNLQGICAGNTSDSLSTAISTVFDAATAAYLSQFFSQVLQLRVYPYFWAWYMNGPSDASGTYVLV